MREAGPLRRVAAVVVFIVLAYAVGPWGIGYLYSSRDPGGWGAVGLILIPLAVGAPAMARLVARRVEYWNDPGRLLPHFERWPYYLAAIGIPLALGGIYVLFVEASNITALPFFSDERWRFSLEPFALFGLGLVVTETAFLAFFEEVGWRGYLQLRLGHPLIAAVFTGIVWTFWHRHYLPNDLTLLVPYWEFITLWAGTNIAASVILGWLTLRSGSVWPAAIAHAVYNAAFGFGVIVRTATLSLAGLVIELLLFASAAAAIVAFGGLSERHLEWNRSRRVVATILGALIAAGIAYTFFEFRQCATWNDRLRERLDVIDLTGPDLQDEIFDVRVEMNETRPLFCEAES